MSLPITLNDSIGLLHVRGEGELTAQDINGYYDRLKVLQKIGNCTKALIDLAAPDVGLSNIPLAYGFVRVFMASRDSAHVITEPFKQMDRAFQWLEISEADLPSPHG